MTTSPNSRKKARKNRKNSEKNPIQPQNPDMPRPSYWKNMKKIISLIQRLSGWIMSAMEPTPLAPIHTVRLARTLKSQDKETQGKLSKWQARYNTKLIRYVFVVPIVKFFPTMLGWWVVFILLFFFINGEMSLRFVLAALFPVAFLYIAYAVRLIRIYLNTKFPRKKEEQPPTSQP